MNTFNSIMIFAGYTTKLKVILMYMHASMPKMPAGPSLKHYQHETVINIKLEAIKLCVQVDQLNDICDSRVVYRS